MGSLLKYFSFGHHDDFIRVSDGRKSMGDNNCSYLSFRKIAQGFLNLFLIFAIKC